MIIRQITKCTCDFCNQDIKPTDYCYELLGFHPDPSANPTEDVIALFTGTVIYDNYIVCSECLRIEEWQTGDAECNADSYRFECGGIYNHNYMDIVGNRDHDCFWDCRNCKFQKEEKND